jgi:glycosyltransferase involved in cell wall biosynthesis
MNTEYPNEKAHSIQLTKILYGLSQQTKVTFICNNLNYSKDKLHAKIQEIYGYDLSRVKFLEISKNKLRGISFFLTIYKRSYSMAKRLYRSKFLHKKKIILESHKKNGYDKEDIVVGSRYAAQRKLFESKNVDRKILQQTYRGVDGIVFTSEESRRIATEELGLRNTTSIWHPLNPHSCKHERDRTIIYSGSLAEDKLIDLLLDALAVSKTGLVVDVIGGNPADTQRVVREARQRGVGENLRFLNRVPHGELPEILCRYKYGLSMMEGLKVADYVECGLTPIIPKIPMYTNIFGYDAPFFYIPDDPTSLNELLKQIEIGPGPKIELDNVMEKYSIDSTAKSILEIIK